MQTAKLEELGKMNLHFPERNCSSALHRLFLNCTRHVASNGDGKWGKYEKWVVARFHTQSVCCGGTNVHTMFRDKDLQEHHATRII